jgi:hypothetical protein
MPERLNRRQAVFKALERHWQSAIESKCLILGLVSKTDVTVYVIPFLMKYPEITSLVLSKPLTKDIMLELAKITTIVSLKFSPQVFRSENNIRALIAYLKYNSSLKLLDVSHISLHIHSMRMLLYSLIEIKAIESLCVGYGVYDEMHTTYSDMTGYLTYYLRSKPKLVSFSIKDYRMLCDSDSFKSLIESLGNVPTLLTLNLKFKHYNPEFVIEMLKTNTTLIELNLKAIPDERWQREEIDTLLARNKDKRSALVLSVLGEVNNQFKDPNRVSGIILDYADFSKPKPVIPVEPVSKSLLYNYKTHMRVGAAVLGMGLYLAQRYRVGM